MFLTKSIVFLVLSAICVTHITCSDVVITIEPEYEWMDDDMDLSGAHFDIECIDCNKEYDFDEISHKPGVAEDPTIVRLQEMYDRLQRDVEKPNQDYERLNQHFDDLEKDKEGGGFRIPILSDVLDQVHTIRATIFGVAISAVDSAFETCRNTCGRMLNGLTYVIYKTQMRIRALEYKGKSCAKAAGVSDIDPVYYQRLEKCTDEGVVRLTTQSGYLNQVLQRINEFVDSVIKQTDNCLKKFIGIAFCFTKMGVQCSTDSAALAYKITAVEMPRAITQFKNLDSNIKKCYQYNAEAINKAYLAKGLDLNNCKFNKKPCKTCEQSNKV